MNSGFRFSPGRLHQVILLFCLVCIPLSQRDSVASTQNKGTAKDSLIKDLFLVQIFYPFEWLEGLGFVFLI